ncbi:hypothetical protein TNCV_2468951 [Trichonephila clavipes]|nr:hypothetical protein TNCV_2468951 [Trichonephila clavipes]
MIVLPPEVELTDEGFDDTETLDPSVSEEKSIKGNTVQKQIGRPSYTISSRVKKIDTVRRDGVDHIIGKREKQRRVKCKIVRENLLPLHEM